jgi:hypothetical protein
MGGSSSSATGAGLVIIADASTINISPDIDLAPGPGGDVLVADAIEEAVQALVAIDPRGDRLFAATLMRTPGAEDAAFVSRSSWKGEITLRERADRFEQARLRDIAVGPSGELALLFVYGVESDGDLSSAASLVVFDASGVPQWRAVIEAHGERVAFGPNAEVAVMGTASRHESGDSSSDDRNRQEAFIASFDRAGMAQYRRRFPSSARVFARGLAVAADGDIVAVGSFEGTMDAGRVVLKSRGGRDAFVVRLRPSGELVRAIRFGGRFDQEAYDVAVDRDGSIAIVGSFEEATDFGCGPVRSNGGADAFVAKLDRFGRCRFSQAFGGDGTDGALSVALDREGAVVVGGSFSRRATLGWRTLGSRGGLDAFVSKLDSAGHPLWDHSFGNAAEQWVGRMVIDPFGVVVVSLGSTGGALDFGQGPSESEAYVVELAP